MIFSVVRSRFNRLDRERRAVEFVLSERDGKNRQERQRKAKRQIQVRFWLKNGIKCNKKCVLWGFGHYCPPP